jgi:hypothetical protein
LERSTGASRGDERGDCREDADSAGYFHEFLTFHAEAACRALFSAFRAVARIVDNSSRMRMALIADVACVGQFIARVKARRR